MPKERPEPPPLVITVALPNALYSSSSFFFGSFFSLVPPSAVPWASPSPTDFTSDFPPPPLLSSPPCPYPIAIALAFPVVITSVFADPPPSQFIIENKNTITSIDLFVLFIII